MNKREEKTDGPHPHPHLHPGEVLIAPGCVADGQRHQQSGRLSGKIALISGGDSEIGRAIAVAFAKEGADIAITYFDAHQKASETKRHVQRAGRQCVTFAGDIGDAGFCRHSIDSTIASFGQLDVLVNNAAEQHPQQRIEDITAEQLQRTFDTNVFSLFHIVKAALPHLRPGSRIINTTSVTAYRGSSHLLDYSATKGAVVAFTRSLSQQLAWRGIYVNAVAPGAVRAQAMPVGCSAHAEASFGIDVSPGCTGEPDDIAPCYVFLACGDSSCMTGQVLHPNAGKASNG